MTKEGVYGQILRTRHKHEGRNDKLGCSTCSVQYLWNTVESSTSRRYTFRTTASRHAEKISANYVSMRRVDGMDRTALPSARR
jgi:hypothetical protein